jgi:MarR family 2-MHQ and catechol resistance regulon transcriptional repressor
MASVDPDVPVSQRKWLPLIRYSHIVSAVVREVLESDPLVEAGGNGITPRQIHLLEYIAMNGRHVDDVAKFLHVSPSAATKAVDKLERRGLIARSSCSGDRRVRVLACSPDGTRLVERYRELQQKAIANAMGTLPPDHETILAAILERYALALVTSDTRADALCLRCSGYYDADCRMRFTQRGCAYESMRREEP